MTPEIPEWEGVGEEIEDLEAPAESLSGVVGGNCAGGSCGSPSAHCGDVPMGPQTCNDTSAGCTMQSKDVVVREA